MSGPEVQHKAESEEKDRVKEHSIKWIEIGRGIQVSKYNSRQRMGRTHTNGKEKHKSGAWEQKDVMKSQAVNMFQCVYN